MKSRLKWVAGLAAVAMALTACSSATDAPSGASTSSEPISLVIGATAEPLSFDPAQAEEGTRLPYYQAVYDTLIRRKPDGSLAPMLATSWTFSADRLSLTLKLRTDVTFTDGTTFDSSAVKANLERFKTENGPQAATVADLDKVETPDGATAVLKLTSPNPALPIYLSNAAGLMASPKALGSDSLKTTPVGSGPYTVDSANTSVGVKYTYVRNAKYWGDRLPYDTITFQVLPDQQAAYNALASGQVNATVLTSFSLGKQAQDAGLQYWPAEVDYQGLMLFDRSGTKVPALKDLRVRQAINFAIDRKALLSSFILDRGTQTEQIWGKSTKGYDESLESTYSYDPAKSKALLAEAGYADGFDIQLPTVPQFDATMMASIVQMLKDVGIRATLKDVPFADFFTQLRKGQWPVTYMIFFQPSDWQVVNQFIDAKAPWNPFHSTDATVAQLIEKMKTGTDADFAQASKDLNKYMVDQAWFAPFYRVQQQSFSDAKTVVEPQAEQAAPSIYNYSPKK